MEAQIDLECTSLLFSFGSLFREIHACVPILQIPILYAIPYFLD